jgi:hypothetical protein
VESYKKSINWKKSFNNKSLREKNFTKLCNDYVWRYEWSDLTLQLAQAEARLAKAQAAATEEAAAKLARAIPSKIYARQGYGRDLITSTTKTKEVAAKEQVDELKQLIVQAKYALGATTDIGCKHISAEVAAQIARDAETLHAQALRVRDKFDKEKVDAHNSLVVEKEKLAAELVEKERLEEVVKAWREARFERAAAVEKKKANGRAEEKMAAEDAQAWGKHQKQLIDSNKKLGSALNKLKEEVDKVRTNTAPGGDFASAVCQNSFAKTNASFDRILKVVDERKVLVDFNLTSYNNRTYQWDKPKS